MRILALAALAALAACGQPPMTADACAEHLDRLVALELRSRGFQDPALERRWQAELRRTLAAELTTCAALPRDEHLLACTRTASDDRAFWRDCLPHAHRPREHDHEAPTPRP